MEGNPATLTSYEGVPCVDVYAPDDGVTQMLANHKLATRQGIETLCRRSPKCVYIYVFFMY